MKRLPLIVSFLLFIALCATLSFWGLRLFKPATREVSLPGVATLAEPGIDGWGGIFGNSKNVMAGNAEYALKGVILAHHGSESVAIISVNDKPNLAVQVGAELSKGVLVKEVYHDYVLISDNGVVRRLELPQNQAISSHVAPPQFRNEINQNVPVQVAPPPAPPPGKTMTQTIVPMLNSASMPNAN
jgi:general secretion pathway protein C